MAKDKDDLLRQIAGLLAKAESTEFEGERDSFLAKADELMMKYSIELWELDEANKMRIDARKPVIRDFDYTWAFGSGPFPEIADALWSLFCSVAGHANCSVVFHKQHYSGETGQYKTGIVPVIGTESDLGYMTLLFSSLMTQLVDKIHPRVDKNKGYEENLRTFREAGWGWLEVAKVMQEAGYDLGMTVSDARHKEAHAYRRWCKRAGIDQNYAHFKTYRRNFGYGFVSVLDTRFREMRVTTAKSLGSGMELALRDQREINREFMYAEFPDMGGRRGSLVKDNRKYDSAAMSAGRAAGQSANITVNPSKGVKDRKTIGK